MILQTIFFQSCMESKFLSKILGGCFEGDRERHSGLKISIYVGFKADSIMAKRLVDISQFSYREFLQTVLVLDIQRHRYEDEEQETTQNRFSLASLLEVCPQNYQMVSLGMPSVSPNERVGKYVSLNEWNTLITNPDTIALTANAMSADIDDMISEVTYGIKKGLIYL
ncbi:hypothetical protein Tco_1032925 [Tanacetum coccineum]|uniref:Uncharacterized protein n=1 Tax=Tanacetum coccineum TaxID=301880 RepID=A0ABQ5GEV8_9ASTR